MMLLRKWLSRCVFLGSPRRGRPRRGFFLANCQQRSHAGMFVAEILENRTLPAATPLLIDIRSAALAQDSDPSDFTNVNGTLFFAANDGTTGRELWMSDGFESGTVLVVDLNPGGDSILSPEDGSSALQNVNGTLFFAATDGTSGFELWKSDGTEDGTIRVADIRSGAGSAFDAETVSPFFTNVNGVLFFVADDGVNGAELWKSNGTTAGTVRVADINPGEDGSFPQDLTNVNGTLFFTAFNETSGRELWKSNGTTAGTVRVAEIRAGADGSDPDDLTNVNGGLFFSANDGTGGRELWKSNGTTSGTVRVSDIQVGDEGSDPASLTNVNGTLFFSADDGTSGRELWKSNGTAAGTVRVTDIFAGDDSSNPQNLTNVDGTLFFTANDGENGIELWKSRGTAATTLLVSDINPGVPGSSPGELIAFNGSVFFAATDVTTGRELWRSNGTDAGTDRIEDIRAGVEGSNPTGLTIVNGTLFFSADNGLDGEELWTLGAQEISVSLTPETVTENGSANLVYTFTRVGDTAKTLTVSFLVTGTATRTTDFSPGGAASFTNTAGTVTFAAGQTTKTITINPTGDTTVEDDETVTLTITSGATYSVGEEDSATGTILNDDVPRVTIAVSPARITENGMQNAIFTFSRTGPTNSALLVGFTVDGTATLGDDYAASGSELFDEGLLVFDVGQATKTITVNPTGDLDVEMDETVIVTLAESDAYSLGTPRTATATILNDEAEVTVSVAPDSVAENGTAGLVYTFRRVGAASAPLTIHFDVDGTARVTSDFTQTGADAFSRTAGRVTLAANQTTKTVTLRPVKDNIREPDETVTLTVRESELYTLGTATSATGTIASDDPRVTIAVSPNSVTENGIPNAVFTLRRSHDTIDELTVNFAVSGTAIFGDDYSTPGTAGFALGEVTFAAGSQLATVTVNPTGDQTVELNETVILTLIDGTDYSLGSATIATATISNDDTEIAITLAPETVTEDGSQNLVYTITRTGVTTTVLTVGFDVEGTATLRTDYAASGANTFTATAGTVRFQRGEMSKTITLNPVVDTLMEEDETITLTLSESTAYTLSATANSATGTITNDDPRVIIAVFPSRVAEDGVTNATFTFFRTGSLAAALTVSFSVGGTAEFDDDYTAPGTATFTAGEVTFAVGQATVMVVIDPTTDAFDEVDETVILTILAGVGYAVGSPLSATATIANDDP